MEIKMSESKIKDKSIKKTTEKILESKIHPILLFYGISFSLFIMYYSFINHRLPIMIALVIILIASFLTYYNYYGRKIVITKNKFYVYRLGKKTISLSFAKDFLHVKFEQTRLGKILNYGSVLLVTQENRYYQVHFVKNPEEVFYTSIEEYENIMTLINPEYEKRLSKDDAQTSTVTNKISKNVFEKIED